MSWTSEKDSCKLVLSLFRPENISALHILTTFCVPEVPPTQFYWTSIALSDCALTCTLLDFAMFLLQRYSHISILPSCTLDFLCKNKISLDHLNLKKRATFHMGVIFTTYFKSFKLVERMKPQPFLHVEIIFQCTQTILVALPSFCLP